MRGLLKGVVPIVYFFSQYESSGLSSGHQTCQHVPLHAGHLICLDEF